MSATKCPVCKTDTYLNPDMVLYISPCFHKLCETCLIRLFSSGKNKCPQCDTELRKINYMTSTFEDVEVEMECKIRKLCNKYFYREESDFEDICKYNDYLEEYENLIYKLMDMKDQKLIKEYINKVMVERNLLTKDKVESSVSIDIPDFDTYIVYESIIKPYTSKVQLPGSYFAENLCGGVSKDLVISYFFYIFNQELEEERLI